MNQAGDDPVLPLLLEDEAFWVSVQEGLQDVGDALIRKRALKVLRLAVRCAAAQQQPLDLPGTFVWVPAEAAAWLVGGGKVTSRVCR